MDVSVLCCNYLAHANSSMPGRERSLHVRFVHTGLLNACNLFPLAMVAVVGRVCFNKQYGVWTQELAIISWMIDTIAPSQKNREDPCHVAPNNPHCLKDYSRV